MESNFFTVCTTYFKIYISEIKFWEQGRSASTKILKKGFGLLYFEVHYRTCDPALCLKSSYPVVHTSASIVPIAHWNWIFIVLVENIKFNIPSATEPFHLVDFLSELYQRCWIKFLDFHLCGFYILWLEDEMVSWRPYFVWERFRTAFSPIHIGWGLANMASCPRKPHLKMWPRLPLLNRLNAIKF